MESYPHEQLKVVIANVTSTERDLEDSFGVCFLNNSLIVRMRRKKYKAPWIHLLLPYPG